MPARTPMQILTDQNCLTMSLIEAAQMLGICKNTAYAAVARNGHLVEGVPVMTVETGNNKRKRLFVSTAHMRKVLGIYGI